METQIQVMPESQSLAPLSVQDVMKHVKLVQDVMRQVMTEGEHYGKIPGCGDKPALFKAGAEKLAVTFRLTPRYEVTERDLGNDHREYSVKCSMYAANGNFLGEGVGVCSTMESKYRYRGGEKIPTDKPVPKDYWNLREEGKYDEAQALLGGRGFGAMKNEGQWVIAEIGAKMDNPNPADCYNTCLKMGKKRAHVDATLTVTGASDMFTQDIEETTDGDLHQQGKKAPAQTRKPIPPPAQKAAPQTGGNQEAKTPPPANEQQGANVGEIFEDASHLQDKQTCKISRVFSHIEPPAQGKKASRVFFESDAVKYTTMRHFDGIRRGDPVIATIEASLFKGNIYYSVKDYEPATAGDAAEPPE